MPILAKGYSVIIQQKVGNSNKPIYPYTRTTNVFTAAGSDLETFLAATYEPKANGSYVPSTEGETTSNLRFLRNDNTWANIQEASTSQKGVVQLTSVLNSDSETLGATAKAAADLNTAIGNLDAATAKAAWIGASTAGNVQGIAPLDANGVVPSAYLPSYVSDVFEVRLEAEQGSNVYTKAYDSTGAQVTPKGNAIYVYCIGESKDNNTYRWSGSQFVEISKSLAIGTTTGTAFDGGLGNAVYTWYQGMGNVENKSSATIRGELTTTDVRNALGLSVAGTDASAVYATSTVDGIMSKEYAAKLDNCQEIIVSETAPSFASGNGLWIQVVEDETAPTP